MRHLNDLRGEIRDRLTLKVVEIRAPGGRLEVGEEFVVTFRIMNAFSRAEAVESPAVYRDVRLAVRGTAFAEVVGGDRTVTVAPALHAGESKSLDISFRAVAKFPEASFAPELNARERFVDYQLTGTFDLAAFCTVVEEGTASVQIFAPEQTPEQDGRDSPPAA